MITMPDIWRCITTADNGPAYVPEITFQAVVVEPPREKSTCLYVNLPGHPVSAELTDDMLEHGVSAFVAESKLFSTKPVTWVDLRQPDAHLAHTSVELPLGLIVPDANVALRQIAGLLRSESGAGVVAIVGAEGLRTSQRLIQSVLSQRFMTDGPDWLLCDPQSTARGLLTLGRHTERLLMRLDLTDPDNARFVAESVRPDVVVLTNTRTDDAGKEIASKVEDLIRSLPDGRLAIVNADDPGAQGILADLTGRVFCYGVRPTCDLWASQIESQGREGLRLRLHYRDDTVHVRVPLLGRNSVHTALAAAAVGLESQQSWEEIVAGLRAMSAQLHLIVTPGLHGSSLIEDSYDATPSSTLSALNLLQEFPGRKVAVLGDMIEFAPLEVEGHRKIGRRVVDVASVLVTVGSLGEIAAREALACGMAKDHVYPLANVEQAIMTLREVLEPGDLALVTGAGRLNMKHIVDQLADNQTSLCEL